MCKYIFKIKAILVVALASMALVSCDDFLDKELVGNPTEDDYYTTNYQLQTALNATYDLLQSDSFTNIEWWFGEACGDDVIDSDEGLSSDLGQLVNFRFSNNNSKILERWTTLYKGVHRANQVIANIHKCEITNTQYNTYKAIREIYGQAKFLRAFYYFGLVKTFGGVPIRPEVETVDNLVIPRSSLEECYAYIEKDLREAAVMLPNRYSGGDCGKAGAGAAVGLLMKVLMYEATNGTPSEKWEQCAQMGDYFVKGDPMTMAKMLDYPARYEGMDWDELRESLWFKPKALNAGSDPYEGPDYEIAKLSTAYSLEYRDAVNNPLTYYEQFWIEGEFCKGSVFEIVFKESGDGTSGDTNEGGYIYDTLFSTSTTMWANDERMNTIFGTDARRQYVLGHHQTTPDMQNTEIGSGRNLPLKWYTPVKDRSTYGGDNGKNRRVMRYPEVVLTYAEALNECGRRAEALEALNSNKRVVNKIDNSTVLYIGGGYGYLRDQIWKERRIELAFEWDRFWDIVRTGRAKECLAELANSRSNKRGLYFRKGVNEIFPIPQNEIDISNGIVTQNPGY
ncbi:MAG: RagB/SusD family nutrient uptake outer membrane protein [Muribaculaceae bacterium]|nr:RagB/SusD family nutrient uptake outer membrane protein [Muribaculaceae bacterium]